MDTRFKSKPGEAGSHPVFLSATLAAATASGTTTQPVPTPASRRLFVRGASFQASTVIVGAGTVVARLVKREADGTQRVLSSDLDLEAVSANTPTAFTIPSSTPDSYRVVKPGELLQVLVVSSSTISTPYANAAVTVDAALLQ